MVTPLDDEIAVYEAVAGAVFPEDAVRAQLLVAVDAGAELRFGVHVTSWGASGAGVHVTLDDGTRVEASRLAICAGPWFGQVASELGIPLRVERKVQFWFAPIEHAAVTPAHLPIYAVQREGQEMFYGFPDFGGGAKIAHHGRGDAAEPDALDRDVRDVEIEAARAALASFVPAAAGAFIRADPCMYTLTPDQHFVIGFHPAHRNVVVAGGFSGHGFKFTPVVGEIVAALLAGDDPGFALDLFSPTRFALSPRS
jgi:sarcosine oxidase